MSFICVKMRFPMIPLLKTAREHKIQEEALPEYVRIKRSKRARRTTLRFNPAARVFDLVVPHHIALKKALKFAGKHDSWMRRKLAALPAPIPFENGQALPILDVDHSIVILHSNELKRTVIDRRDQMLRVKTNLQDPAPRIRRYLKRLARRELETLAREKAGIIGKTLGTLQIRDSKTRWGSCSAAGNIALSWRLIFAPQAAMDYVVAHEVAHLEHLNHGKAFWRLCEKLSKDYADGKTWMRTRADTLMRYG